MKAHTAPVRMSPPPSAEKAMFSQVSKAHAAAKAIATPKMVLLYRVAGAIKRDASTPVTKHAVRFTLTGRTR